MNIDTNYQKRTLKIVASAILGIQLFATFGTAIAACRVNCSNLQNVTVWGTYTGGGNPTLSPGDTYNNNTPSFGGGTAVGDGGGTETAAADRTEPACIQEQVAKSQLQTDLASPDVQTGSPPPGREIFSNNPASALPRLNDPAFVSPSWSKYQVIAKWGWQDQGGAHPYTITIHYMFNSATRQSTQIKFKNLVGQGCGIVEG